MAGLVALESDVRVEVAECRLDCDADIVLSDAYAMLDAGERERAARFVFAVDRDRFIRAHGFMRRSLGARLGLAPGLVPITGDEGEKPGLARGGLDFSLSHSGDHAVLGIASGGKVGVDIELLDRSALFLEQLNDLAAFCMLDHERAALTPLSPPERVARFLSFWTAKEARMKLTGEGVTLEPTAIALELNDGKAVGYRRPRAPRAGLRFAGMSRKDAICCIAVDSDTDFQLVVR